MLDSGRSCRVPCGEFVQELHEKCGGEVDAGHFAHSVLEAQFTAAIAVFDGPRRAYGLSESDVRSSVSRIQLRASIDVPSGIRHFVPGPTCCAPGTSPRSRYRCSVR